MRVFRYVSVERDAPHLLDAWLCLRRDLYLAAGFLRGIDLGPTGAYADAYDEYAEHLLVYDARSPARPVATCRLIDGGRGPLPVDDEFGIGGSACEQEVSGFAVAPHCRGTLVSLGLQWLAFRRAYEGGRTCTHVLVEAALQRSLARAGLPLVQTAPPRWLFHTWNTPLSIPTEDVLPSLRAADSCRRGRLRLADLFESPFGGELVEADVLARTR